MNIETLITEARDRQIAANAAYRTEQERRARAAADALEEDFRRTFGGDLYGDLENLESIPNIDGGPHLTFAYQMRDYRISVHVGGDNVWHLTRLDPRSDDDERRLPSERFTEVRHGTQENIDRFVLALYELDQTEGVPYPAYKPTPAQPTPPSAEERLLRALREMMQGIASDSHDM